MPAEQAAMVAVYIAIGADRADDLLSAWPACEGTLLQDRYVRQWLARHRHRDATGLIATLTEVVETARSQNRSLILPELPVAPMPSSPAPG